MHVSLSTWAIRPISVALWWWLMIHSLKQGYHEDSDSYYVSKWKNIFHHWRGKEQNPELLWENKCLVGGILFFVFDWLLTYIDFDVYFMIQLIKTSKMMIRDSYALLQPIYHTVACQLVGKLFLGSKKSS